MDQQMNTVIVPKDDPDLIEFFKHDRKQVDKANQHKTRNDLWKDIRAYLDGTYEERNDRIRW